MNRAAMLALTPVAVAYGFGVRLRNNLYRQGLFRSFSVGVPVISIGNLTMGGTGKTPLVEWLAGQLAASGKRVCVLTRGYGRKSSGRVLVSDYSRVLADIDEGGDEALMLAQNLRGRVAVICDRDRIAAAQWAKENLGCDVFVLDDAFQHRRIARQLDIVAIDATNPWGSRALLPAGTLREPMNQLKRADCVVITRADEPKNLDQLRAEIETIINRPRLFTSRIKLRSIRLLDESSSLDISPEQSPHTAAFCGIGNPSSFFSLLHRNRMSVTYARAFRDHHHYTQSDVDSIVKDARSSGARAVVTTAKDAVKLRSFEFALPCYVVHTSIEVHDHEEFLRYVNHAISTAD
ncbi:MAG TPA: tetraacyldisaccharide 4'-kinase [Pyrinomonadaceae bacterium]|jgi:tetraacyldisaccharide 4'-kinase|nr:tetraacyldisaccharide 4'-kinase [Pyrinomonadaceae bacterium]